MECLLSYIEFVQYQKEVTQIIEHGKTINLGTDTTAKPGHLCLPSLIPTSSAMDPNRESRSSNIDSIADLKIKAHKIYNKYIKIGCEFEINVSFRLRNECKYKLENLENLLGDDTITIQNLFDLYDRVKKEMIKLLQWSLIRFKAQPQFDKINSIFASV